ncbi:MAG TPA: TRAP transporter substrate-binding protein [Acidiferrobacterales bacterium]|nr:TRAP transporter substrate-binding protein [Acidiferrobacterales bacterium]
MKITMLGRLAAVLAAGVFAVGAASAEEFTMKLSSPTINDVVHEWMKTFKAGVESRSGGRIKVEIYPASQLGQIPRTVEGVALGTIEMTLPASGFLVSLEPRFQVFDAVGVFNDMRHAMRVLNDEDIRKRLATFGADKGVEPLSILVNSPNALLSHKPVRALADLTGQKIRVPGGTPLNIEPFKKLGASPISMPLGEVLPALQNHTIDGLVAAATVYTAFKYYDIAKGLTYLPSSFLFVPALVNRNFMKSLGPDLGAIVREEARKADAVVSTWGVEDFERTRKTWEQHGGENITLPPAEAKRFIDEVTGVMVPILSANPQIKADYEAFLAAAKKHRQ